LLQIRRRRLARLAAVTTTRVPTPTPAVSDVIPQQIPQCNIHYLNTINNPKIKYFHLLIVVPTRITFATQPIKTDSKDLPMEVENGNTDVESKNNIVSPIKAPGPSSIITPEEDSGFENMEVDEPKESNFQESIRRKRPLELPVVI